MKKLFTMLTLVALTTMFAFGQWQVVKEASTSYQPNDGYAIDANTVVVVGNDGEVVKTTDGGTNWTTLRDADGSGIDWTKVEFADANVGYAAASDGYIFKTTDGGANWTMIGDTANFVADLKALSVVDANTVYFSGMDWTLLKTSDGGANFIAQGDSTLFMGDDLDGAIAFSDADNGVVIADGTGGYTWYTHDGGANWTMVSVGGLFPIGTSSSRIYDVAVNGNMVVVGGYHYAMFISTDGGETYALAGNGINYGYERFITISIPDANTIVASGTDGYTQMSTDAGANWTELALGTGQQAVFVDYVDATTGYLFCAYGQFLKTTDGTTFSPLLEWPQVSFWGLALPETDKIVISGYAGGELTISTDGGSTWDYPNNFATGVRENLYECEFLDANIGLAGGGYGTLIRTADAGVNWTPIESPMSLAANKHINAINVFDATTAFTGGSSGYVMKSVDAGLTWTDTKVGTGTVYDIFALDANTVLASETSGQLRYGEFDASGAVVTDSLVIDVGSNSMRAVEVRNNVVLVPASSGLMFRTTLSELDTLVNVFTEPDGDDLYDVEFITDDLVYVVGENGKVYKSEDAGLTWIADPSGMTQTLQKVKYDGTNLWAVGQDGVILKQDLTPAPTELTGDYYIPKGSNAQGFATLGEAVTAANTIEVIGTVNFLLDADTLREESFTFNADLSADNNVVVKPASGRNVVLIVAPGASKGNGPQMIGFDKGYVTIDGSNDGSDSRNLTITNEVVADVPVGLNTANADMVVLKNIIIKNLDNGVKNFKYGPVTNDVAGIVGFTVENCQIGSAEFPVWRDGIAIWGSSTDPTQGIVLDNEIYAGCRGITTYVVNDCEFSGNTICMLPTTSATTYAYVHGIYLTGASGPTIIHNNTISCLEAATVSGTYIVGIAFAGNSEGAGEIISIVNNMVNVGAADGAQPVYGIGFRSANNMGNIQAYYNTILINENTSTSATYAVGNHTNGSGPVTLDLMNNIIINNHSGSTGSSAIGMIPTTSVLTADYNVLVSNQNFVNFKGTSYADLAAWQATGKDANSVSKAVTFASATDLHLAGSSITDRDLAGTPIEGITMDIDGDTRSTTLPYKGADESDEIVLSIDHNVDVLPESFKLHQNYPNPFNPTTTIAFDLPEAANVRLVVYNMMGNQVATLKNENMQAGFYNVNFDASRLASGVYIYRIEANRFSALKKMTIMK